MPSIMECSSVSIRRDEMEEDMERRKVLLEKDFTAAGQPYIFKYWEELEPSQKLALIDQLKALPYTPSQLTELYKKSIALNSESVENRQALQPINEAEVGKSNSPLKDQYWELGINSIRDGFIGVITLAGGQGSRLGSSLPKGLYSVGLPSEKSLFQLQAERILKVLELSKSKKPLYWYIMTSEATHGPTVHFFEENKYFGLKPSQVLFFSQSQLPSFNMEDGKLLMNTKYSLSLAPDGNGGLFKALKMSGVLEHMIRNGIRYVHVYCVDNLLIKVADPEFIGYFLSKGSHPAPEIASKVVVKTSPLESVGILAHVTTAKASMMEKATSPIHVIEYSEMKQEDCNKKDANGNLLFKYANIANHFFGVPFLIKMANLDTKEENHLSYHIAKKKIPFINNGLLVEPNKPNGLKLESFIFDSFLNASTPMAIFQVERDEEFSPLKNITGPDSPSSCCKNIYGCHLNWLRKYSNWTPTPFQSSNYNDLVCEISPLVSYNGEGLPDLSQSKLEFPLMINSLKDFEPYFK